jgi:integrase
VKNETKGSIEKLPSGRYRARRGRVTVGTYDVLPQAQAALGGGTLGSWWSDFAVRRRQVVRDWATEESRWELYFANDPIARTPFFELKRRVAKLWLNGMIKRGLAPQTIKNAMSLGRIICADVLEAELIEVNPFTGMSVPKTYKPRAGEGWTILDPDEQIALLDAVDDDEYHLIAFALHTGLRNSELWNLRFEDIDLDAEEIVVRAGKRGITKTGKVRRVPLIGLARQAAQWAFDNRRCEYVWPSPKAGEKRFDSSQPHRWHDWVKAAGIKRGVRFYDLRHTCATSLLAGWWGPKWALDDVQQILGHGSAKMTERYAHLVDDSLKKAAAKTRGLDPTAWDENGAAFEIRTRDLRFTKSLEIKGFSGLALRRSHERALKQRKTEDDLTSVILKGVGEAFAAGRGEQGARERLTGLVAAGAELLEASRG